MSASFLEGYRVLDLSQFVPGPYTALILADLGADVVKVEPPGGDPMRQLGPRDSDGLSVFYKVMNGGKTVVTIDLKQAAGRGSFLALVAAADALVESYRPGVLARLDLAPERLREVNPGLVHCALSGYGQTGPYRLRAGHDINYMALGGGLAVSGGPGAPRFAAPPAADYASGLQAAATLMAALLGRGRSGRGAYLDLSLAETVLAWQSQSLTGLSRPGHEPRLAGNLLNGGAACYQIYATADGQFITLGAIEEKFWANFCEALERPDWRPRQWEPMPQTGLIAEVAAAIAEKPLAHWQETLDAVDCCYQPVVAMEEVAGHPQIVARKMVQAGEGAEAPIEVLYPAWIDGAPPAGRAPLRQSSAEEVLAAWSSKEA